MCTITCYRDSGRLLVTMNRDEFRSRASELPPARFDLEAGLSWVGPTDGEMGGAWIGLHSAGWTACLMNRYPSLDDGPASSRGEIIPHLMANGNLQAAGLWLAKDCPLDRYRPFTLLLASVEEAQWAAWDGRRLSRFSRLNPAWSMLTSSSWRQPEVQRWRREHFEEWVSRGAAFEGNLPAFHLLQPENKARWAPLMERPETHTRSITQIRVGGREEASERVMWYWPRPAPGGPGEPLRLAAGPSPATTSQNRHG